jgi:transcriptional regulator with XRE-family HTH domain
MLQTMVRMDLAEKLRTLCAEHRLKPADLARALGGVPKSTMSNWWNGVNKPDLETALKMARILNVPLDFLADDSLDDPPPPGLSEDERYLLKTVRSLRIELEYAIQGLHAAAMEQKGQVAKTSPPQPVPGRVVQRREPEEREQRKRGGTG